jgi:hypothetical protein
MEANAFRDQRGRGRDVPSAEGAERAAHRRRCGSPAVPQLVEPAARFLGERDRTLVRPRTVVRERERQPDHRRFPRRIGRRRKPEAALARLDRRPKIVLFGREVADVRQHLDPQRQRSLVRRRQRGFDERAPLGNSFGGAEVPPQPYAEAGSSERMGRPPSVGEGSPEVVVLQFEPSHPRLPLLRA